MSGWQSVGRNHLGERRAIALDHPHAAFAQLLDLALHWRRERADGLRQNQVAIAHSVGQDQSAVFRRRARQEHFAIEHVVVESRRPHRLLLVARGNEAWNVLTLQIGEIGDEKPLTQ